MDNLDDCTTKEELESCPDNILSKEAQLLIDNGGELNGCGDVIRFRTTHGMYVFEYKLHSNMLTIDTSEYDYTPSHRVELILYPISGTTFIESLKAIITYLTNIKRVGLYILCPKYFITMIIIKDRDTIYRDLRVDKQIYDYYDIGDSISFNWLS